LQQLLKGMLIAGELDPLKLAMGIRDIENNPMTSDKLDQINNGVDNAAPAQ
jgi:hypothetical protein